MEYTDVKERFSSCPDLSELDAAPTALLLWRSDEVVFREGETIYAEGAKLDNTFCLLLSGELLVEKAGKLVGQISEGQIFGEMAFFSPEHTRTATVRVGAAEAAVLKIQLSPEELASARLSVLRKYLGLRAWERFVSDAEQGL
jgi:CRP-like cAMP-binding protein